MAYGDVNYELVKSASVIYSTTALSQLLLLTDNSLSANFNLKDVLFMDAELMNANAFRITASSLSNDSGVTLNEGSAIQKFRPMTVGNINNLAVYLSATSSNASATYTFWTRNQ